MILTNYILLGGYRTLTNQLHIVGRVPDTRLPPTHCWEGIGHSPSNPTLLGGYMTFTKQLQIAGRV